MNRALSKFLYISDVGFDTSEMPMAGLKEEERQILYRKRTEETQDCSPTTHEWFFCIFGPWIMMLGLFVFLLVTFG